MCVWCLTFDAVYIFTDHTCGETFLSSVGSFNAPEINDGYREAPECTWAIFSEEDDLAQLRVTQLYIEEMYIGSRDTCDKDYLEVNYIIWSAKHSWLSDHFPAFFKLILLY